MTVPGVAKLRALTAILLAGFCVAEQETYLSSYQSVFSRGARKANP